MDDRIAISLIVLTYNRPRDLRRCLDSIVKIDKGRTSYEVVVVDDGGTEGNETVVSEFSNRLEIRYLKKPHGGVASARNFGARAARGELIAFIADDYILPVSYIRDVTEFLASNEDAYVITHNIYPTGPSLFRYAQRLYYQMTLLQMFELNTLNNPVQRSFNLPPSRAAVFRKKMFEITGYFNEGLLTGEDGELGMRMAAKGIPVYFFMNKHIKHWEDKGLLGYLEQRVRYGASFYTVLRARDGDRTLKPTLRGITKSIWARYSSWLKVSFRLNRKAEYLLLSPFTILFLVFYYRGFYMESRKTIPAPDVVSPLSRGVPDGVSAGIHNKSKLNNDPQRSRL